MLTGRDYDTVGRAITILAEQCMTEQGFHVRLPPPTPASGFQVDLSTRRYTVVASLSDAKHYGFKVPHDDESHLDPAAMALHKSIDREEAEALTGSSPAPAGARYRNGCLGVADRQLMGDATSIVFDGISNSPLISQVNSDPRAVDSPEEEAAMKDFADCMSAAGYSSATDPRQIPQEFPYTAPLTKAEKAAAVIQFQCQQSSGVTTAMRAAETAFQLEAIDANPEAFADVKADIASVIRRATTIVEGR